MQSLPWLVFRVLNLLERHTSFVLFETESHDEALDCPETHL